MQKVVNELARSSFGKPAPEQETARQQFRDVLLASKARHLTSFTLYQLLKTAMQRRELQWVQFLIEEFGIELDKAQFRNLIHIFIFERANAHKMKLEDFYNEIKVFNVEEVSRDLGLF